MKVDVDSYFSEFKSKIKLPERPLAWNVGDALLNSITVSTWISRDFKKFIMSKVKEHEKKIVFKMKTKMIPKFYDLFQKFEFMSSKNQHQFKLIQGKGRFSELIASEKNKNFERLKEMSRLRNITNWKRIKRIRIKTFVIWSKKSSNKKNIT